MLPSRGLLRASPSLGFARTSSLSLSRGSLSSRQFGTALRAHTGFKATANSNVLGKRIGGPLAMAATSIRFASTQPPAASPSAIPTPDPATVVPDAGLSTPLDLSGSDLLNMPEQIGYLKTLGLDYGWGPTSMIQWALEHIYIYTGLPWWASLATLAVAIRIAIFKPSLDAAAESQKMQDLRKNPRFEALQKEQQDMLFGVKTKDQYELLRLRNETKKMTQAAGVKTWKMMIPFINAPLGFGAFRLLKGMAELPVPSLENGGIFWFTDLTVADPYYILPLLAAGFFIQGFRVAIPYMAPAQQKTMKIVGLVITPVTLLVTTGLPAGLQFYFVITSALHYFQQSVFYNAMFRRLVGLNPIVKTGQAVAPTQTGAQWQAPRTIETTAKTEKTTIFQDLKESKAAAAEKWTSFNKKHQTKDEQRKAEEYEERRALEEKQKELARRRRRH